MEKLFSKDNKEDTSFNQNISSEEIASRKDNLSYVLDEIIYSHEHKLELEEALYEVENLSVEDTNFERDWKSFCDRTGYPFEEGLSREALVSKKEGSTGILKRALHQMIDLKDDILTVFTSFAGYDVKKIEALKTKIANGELVPKKELDRVSKEKLQAKLATFFVLGNSMKSSDDLIKYMSEPVDDILSNKYDSLFSKQWKAIWSTDPDELAKKVKPSSINLDFKKFKMPLKISDEQQKNVMISFVYKRFYRKLHMYSLYVNQDMRSEDNTKLSHPFGNNVDILEILSKYLEDIKPWNDAETIKLLDFAINKNTDIKKAVTEAKVLFHKYSAKKFVAGILGNAIPHLAIAYAILISRSHNAIITHIGNMSKEMIYYDKTITDIIMAMYETKK